ncbi:MAG: hypothetical protein R2825_27465 [Saprospiraceae bacterium]
MTYPQMAQGIHQRRSGIGKTTLLGRIAGASSAIPEDGFSKQLGHPVPFVATLREEVFRKVKNWKEFIQAIFKQPAFRQIEPDEKK